MWNDLSMSERSELIKLYLKNGITSLSAMKEHYNNIEDFLAKRNMSRDVLDDGTIIYAHKPVEITAKKK